MPDLIRVLATPFFIAVGLLAIASLIDSSIKGWRAYKRILSEMAGHDED